MLLAAGLMLTGCSTQIDKGTKLLEEKKYEEARKIFQKAVKKESMEKEAYRGLGISYFELKQYDKAKEALEAALEKGASETPGLYGMLGAACMETEQFGQAAAYYEKGIAADAEGTDEELRKEMRFNEIYALEKSGNYAEAKTKAEAYLADYPEDETVKKEAEFLATQAGNK